VHKSRIVTETGRAALVEFDDLQAEAVIGGLGEFAERETVATWSRYERGRREPWSAAMARLTANAGR
jgi:hypothetical protein